MKLFCVLDVKANHFLKPFSDTSTVQAIRSFEIAVNSPNSTFGQFPDDFALMELGEFDVQTGVIKTHVAPLNMATARSLVRTEGAQVPDGR